GDPRWPSWLTWAGWQLIRAGQFADAERLLREALTLREKSDPDGLPTFQVRSLLGGALLGQGRYADAEPLILSGYEGMKRGEGAIPPAARKWLADAGRRVVELYERWGRTAEAAAWRAKLGLPERVPPPSVRPAGSGGAD